MHDRELFEKAFSPLHASPDTLTEVRKTMQNEKKTRRALGKGAVIAIARRADADRGCGRRCRDLDQGQCHPRRPCGRRHPPRLH